MISNFKNWLPHLAVIALFIIASLSYFSPVLSGKKLYQSDIVQYKGNARQLIEYRAQGEELYWTDAVFGGMPTYQLGAKYPYDFIDLLDRGLRFLPRPADYLFLYFICFYILTLVLKIPWRYGVLGSLAFGFSTYLIIILGVGHNAKAHAIAYFPLVLSGILLVFQKRYLLGFVVTALGMALELQANHLQMTYYLLITVCILGLVYLIDAIKNKQIPQFAKQIGLMTVAVVLALGTNATNLLATSEYSKESTRGASEITKDADGNPLPVTGGLTYDYITEYSYGISEVINIILPNFAGGGSGNRPSEDGAVVNYLTSQGFPKSQAVQFTQENVPMYWGDQTIVEAPPYLGVIAFFLAVLGLFLIKGKVKYWTLASITLALLLSFGKNFEYLTRFFIDYIPLYDKFRAVTSIQVIIELCIPILACLGVYKYFSKANKQLQQQSLIKALSVVGGAFIILALFGNSIFSFAGPYDSYYLQSEQLGLSFVEALREERFELLRTDLWKALTFIIIVSILLYTYSIQKLKEMVVLPAITALLLFDLVSYNYEHVNKEDFVTSREYDNALPSTPADEELIKLRKEGNHFRVFDQLMSPFNSSRGPMFHTALGGYHGAKPRRVEEVAKNYLLDEYNRPRPIDRSMAEVLGMFNVRYTITFEEEPVAKEIPLAMGNAWMVDSLIVVSNANDELYALKGLNGNLHAYIQQQEVDRIGGVNDLSGRPGNIELTEYHPHRLVYNSRSDNPGFAVFSEVYYSKGWTATIDGESVPIARVNYTLRGLNIPKGEHHIVFEFKPAVVNTGGYIMLASNLLLGLLLLGGLYFTIKKK